jgi:hypothetical protein
MIPASPVTKHSEASDGHSASSLSPCACRKLDRVHAGRSYSWIRPPRMDGLGRFAQRISRSTTDVTLPTSMSSVRAIRSSWFSELTNATSFWPTNRDRSIARMLRSKPPNHFPSVSAPTMTRFPFRREGEPQMRQRRVSPGVEDHVVVVLPLGEVDLRVVDDVVSTERPDQIHLGTPVAATASRSRRSANPRRSSTRPSFPRKASRRESKRATRTSSSFLRRDPTLRFDAVSWGGRSATAGPR